MTEVLFARLSDVLPAPTSGTALPIGIICLMVKTTSGTLNDGASIAGSELAQAWFQVSSGDILGGINQVGVWRNISGVTLSQGDAGLCRRDS